MTQESLLFGEAILFCFIDINITEAAWRKNRVASSFLSKKYFA
jgi:hypothetical protein